MSTNRELQDLLADIDVADIVELLDGMVALLDSDDSARWSNHRWRRDLDVNPSIPHPVPADYYSGKRLEEFERLLAHVRATNQTTICFDVWRGHRHRTALRPLAGGRILFISNPSLLVPTAPLNGVGDGIIEIRNKEWGPLNRLTDREREILAHLASGKTVKIVAEGLERSQKTVEGHRDSIYRKLGANSRVILTLLAIRAGLAPADPLEQTRDLNRAE